jgi:hypothetical protein
MKRSFILILAVLTVAACAERWQKPGATEQDFTAIDSVCQDRAHARFPPLYRYSPDGGRFLLPFIAAYCNRDNPVVACRTPQGDYVFPPVATADQNLDNRWNDYNACMTENGWRSAP